MAASAIKRVTATGDVTTEDTYLRGVTALGGSTATTVTVRAGGATGDVVLVLKPAADTTAHVDLHDAFCGGGVHVTVAGTGAEATLVYS